MAMTATRETTSDRVEVTRHHLKTIQRLSVSQVKSIYGNGCDGSTRPQSRFTFQRNRKEMDGLETHVHIAHGAAVAVVHVAMAHHVRVVHLRVIHLRVIHVFVV